MVFALKGFYCTQGMEYLHSKGIVHFDMKSANLLIGHRDRRVVCKVPKPQWSSSEKPQCSSSRALLTLFFRVYICM